MFAQILVQVRLVVFHRQHVMRLSVADFLDDLLLTAHRVDRHRTTFEVQEFQQFGNRRDLIRLFLHGDLSQRQSVLARSRRDEVQTRQIVPLAMRPK